MRSLRCSAIALLALLGLSAQRAGAQGATGSAPAATAPKAAASPTVAPGLFDREVALATEARKNGLLDEAISHYRKALQMRPSWTEGRWDLATLLYDLDRYDEARTTFRSVVAAEPKKSAALALLGLCEFQLKEYDRALTDLKKASDLGIPSQDIQYVADFHLAILLNRAENYEGAFDILRLFADRGTDTPAIIEAIGLSQLRLPYLPAEAPADAREMILMAGRAGYLMAQNRRSTAARAAFEELVSRFPGVPNVHYALGVCLIPEDPDAALEEFQREVQSSPRHYLAMLRIALEQLKRSNVQAALPMAQKALEIAPNYFATRLVLGRILLEMGDTQQALLHLEKAAELVPESPEASFSLARAYQKAGRDEDAKRMRTKFLTLSRAQQTRRQGADSLGGIIPPESADSPSDKGSLP